MKRTTSKKLRILRNLLILTLLIGLMDFLIADFFLIPEHQFRREEHGNLVGPSTILGKEEIDLGPFQGMIVAETGQTVILWLYGEDIGRTQFICRNKYDDNMLIAPPGTGGFSLVSDEIHLPIVLFDNTPRATRAEIEFTLREMWDGTDFEKTYLLEAGRDSDGFFLFTLDATGQWPGLGAEGAALNTLTNISSNRDTYVHRSIPVQIRFYDITGALIETDSITIVSEAALYLEENGVNP
jgi:hypothetical protein